MISTAATVVRDGRRTAIARRHITAPLRSHHALNDAAVAAGTWASIAAATSGPLRPVADRHRWRHSSTSRGSTGGHLRPRSRRSMADHTYPTPSLRLPRRRQVRRWKKSGEGRKSEERRGDQRFRCCRTVVVAMVQDRRPSWAATIQRRRSWTTASAGQICWAAAGDGGTRARTGRRGPDGDGQASCVAGKVDVTASLCVRCSSTSCRQ